MYLNKLRGLYTPNTTTPPDSVEEVSAHGLVLSIGNSFTRVSGADFDTKALITETLTYENREVKLERQRLLKQMAYAKNTGYRKRLFALKAQFDALADKEIVCWFKDDQFPTGHLDLVAKALEARKTPYSLQDQRKIPRHRYEYPWRVKPPEMRYYQKEMVEAVLKEHRGVLEAATGVGKSLVIANIVKELGVPTLVILPSSALVDQTRVSFEKWFGKRFVEIVTTDKIKRGKNLKPIRLMTIQSVASLQKQGLLDGLVEDLDLVIVDEVHHAGSDSFTALLSKLEHVYFRVGGTATFMRNDSKTLDLWGFLSKRLYHYPASKATEEGYLTPVEFVIRAVRGNPSRNYQKEYKANYGANPEFLEAISEIVLNEAGQNEQILILVDRKDSVGAVIYEHLNETIPCVYISGDDKKETITEAIQQFNAKEIRVLIGSQVIGEGVDVYSCNRLIMARGGRSEIAITQAIGRAVRLAEGKTKAIVHDFRFTGTRFLEKHLEERLRIYRDQFDGKIYEQNY